MLFDATTWQIALLFSSRKRSEYIHETKYVGCLAENGILKSCCTLFLESKCYK